MPAKTPTLTTLTILTINLSSCLLPHFLHHVQSEISRHFRHCIGTRDMGLHSRKKGKQFCPQNFPKFPKFPKFPQISPFLFLLFLLFLLFFLPFFHSLFHSLLHSLFFLSSPFSIASCWFGRKSRDKKGFEIRQWSHSNIFVLYCIVPPYSYRTCMYRIAHPMLVMTHFKLKIWSSVSRMRNYAILEIQVQGTVCTGWC